MKKLLLLVGAMLTLLLSSCVEERYYPEALYGHWVLLEDDRTTPAEAADAPKGPLALTFHGDVMTVDNAAFEHRPFSHSDEWEYYVDKDDFLVITYYYTDEDGTESDTYYLGLSFSKDESELYLTYKPLIGSNKYYTFLRR